MLHNTFRFHLLAACLVSTGHVTAETQSHDPIVVTATRTAQTIENTLAPITLISREDIERSQALSLPELLAGLPGIDISTQGGPGKNTSLFLRGTNSGHTLFMIDGVRVGSATLGTMALEHIPLQQIDHIEIVRGPRSSLYGSEAIGGVIHILTRQGGELTRMNASAGYGTYNTSEATVGMNGPAAGGHYNVQTAFTESEGINAHDDGHPDKDGYRNRSLSASFNKSMGDTAEMALHLSHTEADSEYDNIFDASAVNDSHTLQNTISGDVKLYASDNIDILVRLSQQRDEYHATENALADGTFDTLRRQQLLQGDFHITEDHTLTLGAENTAEEVTSSANYATTERDNRAMFVQMQQHFGQQDVIMALRHDNNEAFGHHNTGNIDWRWQFASNASITAAYGQAFKAPTFNDLYWPAGLYTAGNPDLVPEESRSAEIITRIRTEDVALTLSIFKTRIENLIDWQPVDPNDPWGLWMPENVNKAIIEGIETSVETNLYHWDVALTVNLIDPRDEITNTRLQRRASKSARIDADRSFGQFSAGFSLQAYGSRYSDAANTDELSGYGLLNLRCTYRLSKSFDIRAKIDNLLDKDYETIRDYNNPGRAVFVSLNYAMD